MESQLQYSVQDSSPHLVWPLTSGYDAAIFQGQNGRKWLKSWIPQKGFQFHACVPIYRTVAPVHTSWNNKSQEITVDDSINIISRKVGVPGTYILHYWEGALFHKRRSKLNADFHFPECYPAVRRCNKKTGSNELRITNRNKNLYKTSKNDQTLGFLS